MVIFGYGNFFLFFLVYFSFASVFFVPFCSLLFVVFVFVFVCHYCLFYFFSVAFATRPTNRRRRLAAALRCSCLLLLCCGCCYFSAAAAVQFALLPREHFFGFTAASFHCAALYNTLIQREPFFNLTFVVAVLNFRPHAFTLTFVCGGGTHRVAYTAAVLPNGSNTGRCCAAQNLRKFEIDKGGTWKRRRNQWSNNNNIKLKTVAKLNIKYQQNGINVSPSLSPSLCRSATNELLHLMLST